MNSFLAVFVPSLHNVLSDTQVYPHKQWYNNNNGKYSLFESTEKYSPLVFFFLGKLSSHNTLWIPYPHFYVLLYMSLILANFAIAVKRQ